MDGGGAEGSGAEGTTCGRDFLGSSEVDEHRFAAKLLAGTLLSELVADYSFVHWTF